MNDRDEEGKHVFQDIYLAYNERIRRYLTRFVGESDAEGIEAIPKSVVKIGKNGRYFTDFTLTTGSVGKLGMDYSVEAGEKCRSRVDRPCLRPYE